MRLAHATSKCSNITRSRAFYQRLGFTLIVDAPHYCRFQIGPAETFSIHVRDGPIAPATEIGIHMQSAAALDEFAERLKADGVRVEGPADQTWLWREARVHDPDGHAILFFYAGENHLNPPWRVGA